MAKRRGEKAVLILSGGLDSTTLLYDLLAQGCDVYAVSFAYGQKHRKEIAYAQKTCRNLGVPHTVIDLRVLGDLAPSALTRKDREVPDGHYAEVSMKQTVVPNRNMVMLSLAAAYAIGIGAEHLFYAAHAGDHTIYPDCRPAFVAAMADAIRLCDWSGPALHAPYVRLGKGEIVKKGLALGIDYADTWTCYKGAELPCGTCGSCTERLEAFREAGVPDPVKYATDKPGRNRTKKKASPKRKKRQEDR